MKHTISCLQGDLAALDEEIHRRSGAEYLKLLSQLEEVKGTIRSNRLSIESHRREREENLQAINRAYADAKRMEEKTATAQALYAEPLHRPDKSRDGTGGRADPTPGDRGTARGRPGRNGVGPDRALRSARIA